MSKRASVTLIDLPGTTGAVEAVSVRSVTEAIRCIRKRNNVTAAGSRGAINVWQDQDGLWRCEFQRSMVTLNTAAFKHIAAVAEWLKTWWPEMRRTA